MKVSFSALGRVRFFFWQGIRRNKRLPVKLCQKAYCDSKQRFGCHSGLWYVVVSSFWWNTAAGCNYCVCTVPCPIVIFSPWNILWELKCPAVIMTHCSNKIVRPGVWLTTSWCCNRPFHIALVCLYYYCASCLWGHHKICRRLQSIPLPPSINGGSFSILFQFHILLYKKFLCYSFSFGAE